VERPAQIHLEEDGLVRPVAIVLNLNHFTGVL
jgi:hypothetical protein